MQFEWPVIGHQNLTNHLQQSILTNKLSQAYIFYGPDKVGKKTVARHFLYSVLCQDQSVRPCQSCLHCRQLEKNIHPDVFKIGPEPDKKKISIDQIRRLQTSLGLGSLLNSYKIALIDQSDRLTTEAGNSLLKTLEEPSPKTIIILITANLEALPKTIASRCQLYQLRPVSSQKIHDYLLASGARRRQAEEITSLARGRAGLAVSYFQNQDEFKVVQKTVKKLTQIFRSEFFKRFDLIEGVADQPNQLIFQLRDLIRDLILIKAGADDYLTYSFIKKDLINLASDISLNRLLKINKKINQARPYLNLNVNARLLLENLIISI
ncbi:MAG TPA: DNA polymerase III subunit delta' C-terminal domain-containing protein [Patescibacteria group bacterium]